MREVLKEMVQSHHLVRKQGKGTFVSLPAVEETLTNAFSLTEEMALRGKTLSFKFLYMNLIEATPSSRKLFQMEMDEKVYEIIRLRTVEGRVFAWERSIVPEKYLSGITKEEIIAKGLLPSIRKRTGLYSVETSDEIEVVICPDQVAADLGIPENTAVLKIKRKNLSQNGYIEKCESYTIGQKLNVKHKVTSR